MTISETKILLIILALSLPACGQSRKAQAEVMQDGKVEGTITLNGKTIPLKYIYTGRTKPPSSSSHYAEMLITNEPIDNEILSSILEQENIGFSHEETTNGFTGQSLIVLYLKALEFFLERDGKDGTGEVTYDATLMTPDLRLELKTTDLKGVTFKGDTLVARAASNDSTHYETNSKGANTKITTKYLISFEAKIRNESLLSRSISSNSNVWKSALSALPVEGKAEGTLNHFGNTIQLKYAYAMKPNRAPYGEYVKVLLTNKPLPKEYLLYGSEFSLNTGKRDFYVLYLGINSSGKLAGSKIIGPDGSWTNRFDKATINGFKQENGRIAGAVNNIEDIGTSENQKERASYSVRFDASLKNLKTSTKLPITVGPKRIRLTT